MKTTMSILLAGMLIAAIAGIGIVSAVVTDKNDATFFGQMHRWADNRMDTNEYGYDKCPVDGAYSSERVATVEQKVSTIDEAIEAIDIAEKAAGKDVARSDVYQMGRWWFFSYTEDDGAVYHGRVDVYTGEIILDLYNNSESRFNYNAGCCVVRGGGYGGYGSAYS